MKKKKNNKKIRRIIVYIILFAIFFVLARKLYFEFIKDSDNTLVIKDEPKQEMVVSEDINIGLISFDTFNPILTKNEDVINFVPLVYDSLFCYDKDMKLQKDLVEDYNYNDNKLCIRIKKDILWHDGTNLTTSDIEFTINTIKNTNSVYNSLLQDINEIEIIDKYSFNLLLTEGNNRLTHMKMTFPIISKLYYENEDFTTTYKNLIPMGTGMLRYSNKIGDTEYVFKLNAYYAGEKPKFNQINLMTFDTLGQAISSIKSKKIDIINTKIINYEDYLGTIGYGKTEYIDKSFICLGINKSNNNLSNVNIRKSINCGINKQFIFDDVFNKKGYVSQNVIYPNSYLYENIEENYDINTAKQYLANSNIKEKITLRLLVNNSNESNILISNILKENIESIGISVIIDEENSQTYLEKLNNKDYDLVLINFDISDYIDFEMYSLNKYYGIFDLLGYEKVDSLSNNINYDEIKLKQTYQDMQNYIKENVPYIGIGFKISTLIYNNNLIGVSNPRFRNIYADINEIYKKK